MPAGRLQWSCRNLVHFTEYVLVWATFVAINCLNLELGMLVGVGLAMLLFLVEYSRVRMSESISTVSAGEQLCIASFRAQSLL